MHTIGIILVPCFFIIIVCVSGDNNSGLEKARTAGLAYTNQLRAKHGSPAFTRDPEIDKVAQAYAEKLCDLCQLQHSNNPMYGENIAGMCGFDFLTTDDNWVKFTTKRIQEMYDEIKEYNYKKHGFTFETGHFTAMIWKSSKAQGLGLARCTKTKGAFIVFNFLPKGNMAGSFESNVPHVGGAVDGPPPQLGSGKGTFKGGYLKF